MPSPDFRAAASLWRRKMGGEIPWGPAARAWKPISDHPEFLPRLERYLDAHTGEKSVYANPWKFAQTFGQWAPDPHRIISHDEAVRAFKRAGLEPPAVMPREGYSKAQLEGAIRAGRTNHAM